MKKLDVVCAVIENDEKKLLIAKRNSKVADGIWEFAGGKVEAGETYEAACIRECREELNVDIEIDRFLLDFYDDDFSVSIHVHAYKAHIVSGEPEFRAHYEGIWVKRNELYDYELQTAERCLLDYLKTQE